MSHTVNVDDCKGLEFTTVLASDSSDEKRLNAVIIPERNELRYDVLHEKNVIFTGPKLTDAVDAYNAVPSIYHERFECS